MSNEITTEVLAKAINETKETVQSIEVDREIKLNINGSRKGYKLIHKSASDDNNQLNAMAIAPVKADGKTDYDNVAVVYDGTNMGSLKGEVGKDGFLTAGQAYVGGLSGEYAAAEKFLAQTHAKVAQNNGMITDVAGFSQAGGYMMKMAAEHGQVNGFKTTSFDDWGRNQFNTLTPNQQAWLLANPSMLARYQNDSFADNSGRDHSYGHVGAISGIGDHNTLSKYFNGDLLNLNRLAADGIFAPNMTKAQVEKAAKNWSKTHEDWYPFVSVSQRAKNRVEIYLETYGIYATEKFSKQLIKLNQLKRVLFSSGGGLSTNEKIYLDSEAALIIAEEAKNEFKQATENILNVYRQGLQEIQEIWQRNVYQARQRGSMLTDWEIRDTQQMVNCNQQTILDETCQYYEKKISKVTRIETDFSLLISEIKTKIAEVVQRDRDLARQIKGVLSS